MNIKIDILNVPKHCNKHDLIHFVTQSQIYKCTNIWNFDFEPLDVELGPYGSSFDKTNSRNSCHVHNWLVLNRNETIIYTPLINTQIIVYVYTVKLLLALSIGRKISSEKEFFWKQRNRLWHSALFLVCSWAVSSKTKRIHSKIIIVLCTCKIWIYSYTILLTILCIVSDVNTINQSLTQCQSLWFSKRRMICTLIWISHFIYVSLSS